MNSFNRSELLNTYSILAITNEIASAIFMLIYCPASLSFSRDFLKYSVTSTVYHLSTSSLFNPLLRMHHSPPYLNYFQKGYLVRKYMFCFSILIFFEITILFSLSEIPFIFGKMIFICNSGIKKNKLVFLR